MQAEPGRDEGFVARMRGLPWQATEEDIKKFFHDSKILEGGIILAHNFQGRPTGTFKSKLSFLVMLCVHKTLFVHKKARRMYNSLPKKTWREH